MIFQQNVITNVGTVIDGLHYLSGVELKMYQASIGRGFVEDIFITVYTCSKLTQMTAIPINIIIQMTCWATWFVCHDE